MSLPAPLRRLTLAGLLVLILSACSEAAGPRVDAHAAAELGFSLWDEPRSVPEVNFVDAHGEALSLEAFQGQVVLLNLWATWCQPCRKEMPTLDRLQGQLGGPQFQVVALSIDKDGLAAVREFYTDIDVRRLDLYVDDTGEAITELNAPGIPITLLLDRNGEELGRKLGIAEWDSQAMQGFLQQVINAGQGR